MTDAAIHWMLQPAVLLALKMALFFALISVAALIVHTRPRLVTLLWRICLLGLLLMPLLHLALPGLNWTIEVATHLTPAADAQPLLSPSRTPPAPDDDAMLPRALWLALYCAGVLWLGARHLVALRRLQRIGRSARTVHNPAMLACVASHCTAFGLRRRPRLCRHAALTSPVSWGVFKPVIALPLQHTSNDTPWRHALLHELIHIRRRDWLWLQLGHIARILMWFNPLIWWCHQRLQTAAEQRCDEEVLNSGVRASDYASALLFYHQSGQRPHSSVAAAGNHMAAQSRLHQRLTRVLQPPNRSPIMKQWQITSALVASSLGVVLIGVSQPTLLNAHENEVHAVHPAPPMLHAQPVTPSLPAVPEAIAAPSHVATPAPEVMQQLKHLHRQLQRVQDSLSEEQQAALQEARETLHTAHREMREKQHEMQRHAKRLHADQAHRKEVRQVVAEHREVMRREMPRLKRELAKAHHQLRHGQVEMRVAQDAREAELQAAYQKAREQMQAVREELQAHRQQLRETARQ